MPSVHVHEFDRLFHRADDALCEPDFTASEDLADVSIRKGLSKRQWFAIGVAIGERRGKRKLSLGDIAPGPVSPMSFTKVPLLEDHL